ncbi:mitochondrial acyl carrier protein [Exophiala dermatitidis]|uniref:Acyl carrier protein n=2 Tax=Exophiala dermatitidis TaxID=5970 RepID=H6C3X4_EXODN|nr:NADH dehydrogenase (ubiquinone) 1 alpha/beta subcomplex 1 [Exophiala dermatitidis NIH/UT8656]KAJ4509032.1 mitochondrial acyl carrier protein [Exophiala dermatitidis]EHY58339.1 NADH dehydrogenase (ubiquinone) 1 alpha/beta subcomplex 1 [Exophiala dermatitidis NIH/UT8656]KAJ4511254.1 mitochondrial acyl carrier protein [Exophiala dermatitidis]KAJ4511811.1 mitochondrial acyl carrier protein [Exophiala dermatitidis]KAJ4534667.1 mitochondrial acyl carrier protein [Exophiala dermatitidis]
MIRAGALRALYAATRTQVPRQLPAFRTQISSSLRPSRFAPLVVAPSKRCYSAPSGLSKEEVQGRIMDLLKNFDKVSDPSKITGTSHFQNDLGLDSLDTVEVVMAIEEEFSIEIPDKEADAIHSVDQAVAYICSQPDAH